MPSTRKAAKGKPRRMQPQDTHATTATLATTATTPYDYLLALCRAIGELVDVDEDRPRDTATIYVPGWFEAGGPWQLQHVGGRAPWRVTRADRLPAPGQAAPARLALAFRDEIREAAARMLEFDRAHPFVLEPALWEVPADV